jgi:hypothetical protein
MFLRAGHLWLLAAALAAATLVAAFAQQAVRSLAGSSRPGRPPATASAQYLSGIASEVNKTTPLRVDRDTELLNVVGLDGVLVYNYRLLSMSAAELTVAQLLSAVRPTALFHACNTAATREHLLGRGVILRYTYVDKDRQFVGAFDVQSADCDG